MPLTQLVKSRVDSDLKAKIEREALRLERSEAAIVRIALRRYFESPAPKATEVAA